VTHRTTTHLTTLEIEGAGRLDSGERKDKSTSTVRSPGSSANTTPNTETIKP
jgi:hypothetical protein